MKYVPPFQLIVVFVLFQFFIIFESSAQMRKVYIDPNSPDNAISKCSFFSPSQGYVAFRDWIGYTTDSGRTFTKKYITLSNINFGNYSIVNLFPSFGIAGVKAFNQNSLIVYGDYGAIPSILISNDGGNSFTLVFYSLYNPDNILRAGITDLEFPENNNMIGYACESDRILKTTNGGVTWTVIRLDPNSYFENLDVLDTHTLFAYSTVNNSNKLIKTTDGINWQTIPMPTVTNGILVTAHFLTASTGWMSMKDNNGSDYIFMTQNGGTTWTQQNQMNIPDFYPYKFKFINDSTGFALSTEYAVYKTTDRGAIWEPLPRDNNFSYLSFLHNDIQIMNASQIWAGGEHGFLELSTNGGGTPLPVAMFRIDTLSTPGIVQLKNYSKATYEFTWLLNRNVLSTNYNASYIHQIGRSLDTISLIVFNGITRDTSTLIQNFWVPVPPVPTISSFSPTVNATGGYVDIYGTNFSGATSVKFGGTEAASFTIISSTTIRAIIGTGSTGSISVTTPFGTASKSGFVSRTPELLSFYPASGGYNDVITLKGRGFSGTGGNAVLFGGYAAHNYTLISDSIIQAKVGFAGSGNITIRTANVGSAIMPGFVYINKLPAITSFSPASAKQGDTITLYGSGFTNISNVKFGSTPASGFRVVSPTEIRAAVGPGQSGFVTVYTSIGSPSLDGFIYTGPKIQSFSPAIGGAGTILEITGKNFINVGSITVNGLPVASFTVNSANRITAILGSGLGDSTGHVIVTTSNGSSIRSGFQMKSYPIIYSFAPKAAQPGNLVNIYGANFSPIITGNIVYFGAVRAVVTSANANQISVMVPSGATYAPITVTSNALSAKSTLAFLPTSSPWKLTKNSFAEKVKCVVQNKPSGLVAADFDNDGKADLVTRSGDWVSIFRNTSVQGEIRFDPPIIKVVANGLLQKKDNICVADFDGDGKLDIEIATSTGLAILRNSSTGSGVIAFDNPYYYTAVSGSAALKTAVSDLDEDGKPDLVLVIVNIVELVKNTSTPGNISLNTGIQMPAYQISRLYPREIAIADLNGDYKPDIIVSKDNSIKNGAFACLWNKSVPNSFRFSGPSNFGRTGVFPAIQVADMNNDNTPDVVSTVTSYYSSSSNSLTGFSAVNYHKNIIIADTNYIDTARSFTATYNPGNFALGSLNGDDLPDIFVSNSTYQSGHSLYIQDRSDSTLSLNNTATLNDSAATSGIALADFDGDGKTDIGIANADSSFISVFRNKSGEPIHVCPGGTATLVSSISGTYYQWQMNTDGMNFVNIPPSALFWGVNMETLSIRSISDPSIHARYRCIVDGMVSETYQINYRSEWTGALNNSWNNPGNWSCGVVPNNFTDVVIKNGNIVLPVSDTVRSLTLMGGATLTLNNGSQLTLTGNQSSNIISDSFLVSTSEITQVSNTSARCGGVIPSELNSSAITARGVVWSTAPEPTVSMAAQTNDGSGNGSFTSQLTNLQPNTTYYVRAYATTINGTGYGEQQVFTSSGIPVLQTQAVSSVGYTSAQSGGIIMSNPGTAITVSGVVWGLSPQPTVSLPTKTQQTVTGGAYTSQLNSLLPDKIYYVRAYATNSYGTAYGNEYRFITPDSLAIQTVSLCNQVWMKKNLNVSRYRNGDSIPNVTDPVKWAALTTGAWRWYNNDSATYAATYGKLYNWYAVADPRGLAPEGWHIPTSAEVNSMYTCIDGNSGYITETGTTHWCTNNQNANNLTGFTALPGGMINQYGYPQDIGYSGYWWSSDAGTSSDIYKFMITCGQTYVSVQLSVNKNEGYSIRCIQD